MAFVEDLAPYFADFGEAATLGGQAVRGIFDNAHEAAAVGALGMAATQPAFTMPTASVPATPVGAALVVRGTTYTVVEHRPDGTGVSDLLLEEAS